MRFIILILSISLFAACSEDKKTNHKTYYFPIDELYDTKVYVYEIDHNGEKYKHYYQLGSQKTEGKTYLSTFTFDRYFDASEEILEAFTSTGAEVTFYKVAEKDEDNQSYMSPKASIGHKHAFLWNFEEGRVAKWQFSYSSNLYAETEVSVLRERFYEGVKKTLKFNGKSYPSIELRDKYTIDYIDVSEDSEVENSATFDFRQRSYYAKGLGMIAFEKTFDGDIIKGKLIEIISNKEFWDRAEKFKANQPKENL